MKPLRYPDLLLWILGMLLALFSTCPARAAGYVASITTAYPQLAIASTAPQVPWYGGNCGNTAATANPYKTCDDGLSPVLPIGFSFSFAGTAYTTWSMSTNGVIFFETGAAGTGSTGGISYTPTALPTTTFGANKPALMPFWADLWKSASAAGVADINSASQPASASFIQYEVVTVSGTQVLVIQLKKVGYYGASGTLVNMQVQLWATGQIVYSYGNMAVMASNPQLRIGLQYLNGCGTLANKQTASLSNQSYLYQWDAAASACPTPATVNHYEIRHDGAATLCAEPVEVLACAVATSPCPAASIVNTQIINASVAVAGTGSLATPTISPPSFNLQPSSPKVTANLTWAAGSAGNATLSVQGAVTPTNAATVCTNVAGTTTYANCNIAVANTVCIPPPHHYEIQGPANGNSCSSHTFTIKAWADAAQTTPYTAGLTTGTLTSSGNPVSVPNLGAFSITAGNSTVNVSPITFPSAGTTTFSTTAVPPLAGATTCKFGSSTSCALPIVACSPGAIYRFDEPYWSGSGNEIVDSSGNGRHASLYKRNSAGGTAAVLPTQVTPPNGKKCSAASFLQKADLGIISSVNTPIVPGDEGTVHFWYKSSAPWSGAGAQASMLFDGTTQVGVSGVPFYLAKGSNGALYFYAVNKDTSALKGIAAWKTSGLAPYTFPADEWHHIAVTWDLRSGLNAFKVFVDGALDYNTAIDNVSTGLFSPWAAGDTLHIGDSRMPLINYSSSGASSASANGVIDEFYYYPYAIPIAQIIADRDSAAPTCVPGLHHIQIEHTSGTGVTCAPSTITLKACANASCSTLYPGGVTGTLTASGGTTNWVGGNTFSIGASGTATKDVQVTTTTPATFGASVATPTGVSNATTCLFGAATNCVFTASTAGFIFDVPHHVADVGQSVTVSSVRQSDNSLACVAAFANVNKTINFNCNYANPTTGTLPVTVGASSIACGTGGAVALSFNGSGVASTTVRYADVGQVTLSASYTGSGGAETGLSMSGSDTFIAAPKDFAISPSGPYVAGINFGATVTARNNSGIATPNFGREIAAESVALGFERCQPSGAGTSAGNFTGATGAFSSGVAGASNLNWSEVGNGDLTATLNSGNYLGSGLPAATGTTGTSGSNCNGAGNVGAFKPHHFDTQVMPSCSGSFTFSGQPFTVVVTAKNGLASPATTQNYTSPTFAKAVTLSDVNAVTGSFTAGTEVAASTFSSGVATTTAPTFLFTDKQTAPATLKIRAVDADGVSSSSGAEGTVPLRSGRLRLSNAFGGIQQPLQVPVMSEYWTGSSWFLNSADSCTTVPAASVAVSNARSSTGSASVATTSATAPITISAGSGLLTLGIPSPATSGVTFDLSLNLGGLSIDQSCTANHPTVTGAAKAWLRAINGSCAATPDRDPSARASFGIYTPESKKVIHVREIF